jgi:succinoglycan biosynthesis transport protein ExoP
MHPDDDDIVGTDISRRGMSSTGDVRSLVPFREPPRVSPTDGDFEIDDEQPLGPGDYWIMIRDRLWFIVTLTLIVTVLTLLFVVRLPDVYQAEASIQIDLENNHALGSSKNASVVINDPSDNPAYFNTQVLLLKSPAFLRRVVKTLGADKDSRILGHPASSNWTWHNIFGVNGGQQESANGKSLRADSIAPAPPDGGIAEAQKLEPYVSSLRNGLEVKLTETTRLVSISFSHTDPAIAAKVANVVADTFVQSNWERRAETNSSAGEFLQKRIAELQSKIGENEKRLIDYAKEHQILPPDSGKDIETERLMTLDRGLLDAEDKRKLAEAEYQAALAPGAAAAMVEGSSSANGQLNTINARLADLRQRRAVLLLEAGENWPEVKELNKQITDLEKELKDTRDHAVTVILTNLETRYRQALAREQALRKGFEQQHSQTLAQDEAGINYRMIQQETTTYRALLDNLLQRSKENDVVLAGTPNNFHVTDYATLPIRLVGPKRLIIVAIAFASSLIFGIGFSVFLGKIDDNVPINSVERVERLFGLPALAVLPSAGPGRRTLPGVSALQRRDGRGGNGLLINQETRSPLTESYKKLRTSVLLSTPGRVPKTLLMASSFPAEGKTTAVINTGLVLAQTNGKVLLIDADLRHPSLHEILGIENQQGLSSILSNGFSEDETLAMIEQYEDSDLYILPAGPLMDNPAELLASDRMRSLISTLGSTFAHIIIDSPPLSYFTDAVVLSSIVDGVLLVVRGPKTPRQVARYSLQSLEAVGAPILGVVLNDVNLRSNDYRYYRDYYGRFDSSGKPRPRRNGYSGIKLDL